MDLREDFEFSDNDVDLDGDDVFSSPFSKQEEEETIEIKNEMNFADLRASYGEHTMNELYNSKNFKKPPVQTERTISLMSTSAPHHFFDAKNKFLEASFHKNKFKKIDETQMHDGCPVDFVSHEKKKKDKSKKKFNFEKNSTKKFNPFENHSKHPLSILKMEDDKNIIGSVPHGKFLDEVTKKITYNEKNHNFSSNSSNNHDKFITIRTISFDNCLSPETPQIFIGNPNASKKLLISVGIHGDEPCGMIAFNELKYEGFFDDLPPSLMVTGLVGNPLAVCKNQRFIEFNLNRMIREDFWTQNYYESERSRVVAQAIDQCDILLDLHSCSAVAPAHALPCDDDESIQLASLLPVGYVIKYLAHTTPGKATTLDWVKKKNKIGVCVECGQHEERQTIDNAKNCIITFVNYHAGRKIHLPNPPIILNSRENETVRKGFKFVRKVSAFEHVPFGETIAVDQVVGPIKSKYTGGTYIVMPTRKPVLGEEAFFYAERDNKLISSSTWRMA